jgi:predicted nucleotidyltransferase
MHPSIAKHRADISAICERHQIRKLEVFGSAARANDFDAECSDADFLVEFSPDAPADLHRFFGIKSELESLLGRGVDLIESGAVRNPFVLAGINQHRETLYAA